MTQKPKRIGLVVPSSNVTVETEMPCILARHPDEEFTFHSEPYADDDGLPSNCGR